MKYSNFLLVFIFQFLFFSNCLSQIYTSIDSNFKNIITSNIISSQKTIHALIYKFNDDDILKQFIDAQNRGVSIDIICDKNSLHYSKKINNVTLFDNIPPFNKLHAKSLLFDNTSLLIGSFNLDKSTFSTNFEIMLETTNYSNNFLDKFYELKKFL